MVEAEIVLVVSVKDYDPSKAYFAAKNFANAVKGSITTFTIAELGELEDPENEDRPFHM